MRSLLVLYAGFGAVVATWQVLLADLVLQAGVGAGQLGASITVGGLLSVPAMVAVGRVADRAGTDRVLRGAVAGIVLGLAGYALARSPGAFAAATAVFLVAFGAFDVAVGARALVLEEGAGRRVLPQAYAAFSAGAAVAAISTGLALGAAASPAVVLGVAGALLAVGALTADADPGRPAPVQPKAPRPRVLRRAPLPALAGVVALAFVVQGSLETWTTIYLRTELGQSAALGAAGIAAFHLAMLTGRLLGARLGARVRPRRLLVTAGLVAAAGMALALATTQLWIVVIGVAVVGAASAVVVPTALSLAGAAAPGAAGATAAVLATSGYTAALVAPGAIGLGAEASSLRVALGLVVLAGLGLAALGAVATRSAPARAVDPVPVPVPVPVGSPAG